MLILIWSMRAIMRTQKTYFAKTVAPFIFQNLKIKLSQYIRDKRVRDKDSVKVHWMKISSRCCYHSCIMFSNIQTSLHKSNKHENETILSLSCFKYSQRRHEIKERFNRFSNGFQKPPLYSNANGLDVGLNVFWFRHLFIFDQSKHFGIDSVSTF